MTKHLETELTLEAHSVVYSYVVPRGSKRILEEKGRPFTRRTVVFQLRMTVKDDQSRLPFLHIDIILAPSYPESPQIFNALRLMSKQSC
jgi:hypothetical protein